MTIAAPQEGKHRPRIIAMLLAQRGVIDAAPIDARRRAGLQPPYAQIQFTQSRRQAQGGRFAGPSAGMTLKADMDLAAQEGPHR